MYGDMISQKTLVPRQSIKTIYVGLLVPFSVLLCLILQLIPCWLSQDTKYSTFSLGCLLVWIIQDDNLLTLVFDSSVVAVLLPSSIYKIAKAKGVKWLQISSVNVKPHLNWLAFFDIYGGHIILCRFTSFILFLTVEYPEVRYEIFGW